MFLNIIAQAGQERRVIVMTYVDAKNKHTIRTVEPYEIKEGKFFGFCLEKNAIRAFKLDGIVNVSIQPETFEPRFEVKF